MVRNEQTIIGHGGIFNVPVGKGQVVAFTFDPLHRYLNYPMRPCFGMRYGKLYICKKYLPMKLTIEIGNPTEMEQLLGIFKTLNLESIHVVVDRKDGNKKDLLPILNRPIRKRLDIDALKKAKNYQGVNRKRFDKLVKEINIDEPIELLLSQLSQ